jgi:hypothetical protein
MDGRHKSESTLLFGAACIHPGKRFNYPLLGKTMGEGNEDKDDDNKVIQIFDSPVVFCIQVAKTYLARYCY